MKTICDKCDNYQVSPCGTHEICYAFITSSTKFTNGITKDYINNRFNGKIKYCKEYKQLRDFKIKT